MRAPAAHRRPGRCSWRRWPIAAWLCRRASAASAAPVTINLCALPGTCHADRRGHAFRSGASACRRHPATAPRQTASLPGPLLGVT